jgi:hypothetical protein
MVEPAEPPAEPLAAALETPPLGAGNEVGAEDGTVELAARPVLGEIAFAGRLRLGWIEGESGPLLLDGSAT